MSVHGEKSEGDKLEDPLKSGEQCLQPDATSITVGPEQRKSSRVERVRLRHFWLFTLLHKN